ncbi:DUF2306 domain-containing protein [Roseomonas rosulenta]|uniref:DUF2306 domain-containing protein n=1 Tax=Roseomonas rosulenta TaxID=2748667 RepID=UPI0018DFDC0D|nr:DUF2306 domain-containing protein [Roseomonas rosulenta]
MLLLHLGFSLAALAAILAVLVLPKGIRMHRWLGRVAAAAMLLSAASAFGIQSRGHLSMLHVLSVVTLLNIPYAVWMVRRGRIASHRRAMLSNAGALVVAGLFATLMPGRTLHALLFG